MKPTKQSTAEKSRPKVDLILTNHDGVLGLTIKVEGGKLPRTVLEKISNESGLLVEELEEVFRDDPEIPAAFSRKVEGYFTDLLERVGCEVRVISLDQLEREQKYPDIFLFLPRKWTTREHVQRMGGGNGFLVLAWLCDRVTKSELDEDGIWHGKVLRGQPINYQDIADSLGFSLRMVERHVATLRKGGYIATQRHQYGVVVEVYGYNKFGLRHAKSSTPKKDFKPFSPDKSDIRPDKYGGSETRKRIPDKGLPTVNNKEITNNNCGEFDEPPKEVLSHPTDISSFFPGKEKEDPSPDLGSSSDSIPCPAQDPSSPKCSGGESFTSEKGGPPPQPQPSSKGGKSSKKAPADTASSTEIRSTETRKADKSATEDLLAIERHWKEVYWREIGEPPLRSSIGLNRRKFNELLGDGLSVKEIKELIDEFADLSKEDKYIREKGFTTTQLAWKATELRQRIRRKKASLPPDLSDEYNPAKRWN